MGSPEALPVASGDTDAGGSLRPVELVARPSAASPIRPEVAYELLAGIWAIDVAYMRRLVAAIAAGEILGAARPPVPGSAPAAPGRGTAVIPIMGPISRRPDFLSMLFGLESATTSQIAASLSAALADPSVGRIVLHVDSPGGEVVGMTELAGAIREARDRKPISAYVDGVAGSAAYWLASQASEILVAPSAAVGSIGVFALHLDQSAALANAGVVPTYVQAGKYKTEESPLFPLSADAKAAIQERVDAFYGMFVRDVARGRGVPVETVRSSYGEGRMVLAKDAIAAGMADRISEHMPSGAPVAESNHALVFAAARAAVAVSHNDAR